MRLPFTLEQFLAIFEKYNTAIWPIQAMLTLIAFYAVYTILTKKSTANRITVNVLGFLWLWTGIAYHEVFFSQINKAAYFFGLLFIIQSAAFYSLNRAAAFPKFSIKKDIYSITGLIFIVYALIVYPVFGVIMGHIYPKAPTFGAPCPVVIYTFGVLLLATTKLSKLLFIIPALWAVIGLSASINLHITEDFGLFFAGVIGTWLLLKRGRALSQ